MPQPLGCICRDYVTIWGCGCMEVMSENRCRLHRGLTLAQIHGANWDAACMTTGGGNRCPLHELEYQAQEAERRRARIQAVRNPKIINRDDLSLRPPKDTYERDFESSDDERKKKKTSGSKTTDPIKRSSDKKDKDKKGGSGASSSRGQGQSHRVR